MKFITAEEWQLLSFFEVEPKFCEPDDPWPHVEAVYRVVRGGWNLSVAIHPSYRDVRIILDHDGYRICQFTSMGVQNIRYINDAGLEALEFVINDHDAIALVLKPAISIKQAANIE